MVSTMTGASTGRLCTRWTNCTWPVPDRHGEAGPRRGLEQVDLDVDVPSRGFGVRAGLVRQV
jgi:hypothetical protein